MAELEPGADEEYPEALRPVAASVRKSKEQASENKGGFRGLTSFQIKEPFSKCLRLTMGAPTPLFKIGPNDYRTIVTVLR
jgi:hypothetical protein